MENPSPDATQPHVIRQLEKSVRLRSLFSLAFIAILAWGRGGCWQMSKTREKKKKRSKMYTSGLRPALNIGLFK